MTDFTSAGTAGPTAVRGRRPSTISSKMRRLSLACSSAERPRKAEPSMLTSSVTSSTWMSERQVPASTARKISGENI